MKQLFGLLFILGYASIAFSEPTSPWGVATESKGNYEPQKVLYDVTTNKIDKLSNIINRVSYLNNLYKNDPFDSDIVIIIHGSSIPFFATQSYQKYKNIIDRAYNLTVGSNIEFRMCQASAKLQGFNPEDFHGFIKMVPMADAEIIKLQQNGYAYMK
jgi:hypothetical protein